MKSEEKNIYVGIVLAFLCGKFYLIVKSLLFSALLMVHGSSFLFPILLGLIVVIIAAWFYRYAQFYRIRIWILVLIVLLSRLIIFFNLPDRFYLPNEDSYSIEQLIMYRPVGGSLLTVILLAISYVKYIRNRKKIAEDMDIIKDSQMGMGSGGIAIYYGVLFHYLYTSAYFSFSRLLISPIIALGINPHSIPFILSSVILLLSIWFYRQCHPFPKIRIWHLLLFFVLSGISLYLSEYLLYGVSTYTLEVRHLTSDYLSIFSKICTGGLLLISIFKYLKISHLKLKEII